MSTNVQEQFFKALVDVDRLRVAGLLYERTLSVEAVANELGLQQKHTRHHLECLAEAGLVQVVSDSDGNGYRLNRQQFENLYHNFPGRAGFLLFSTDRKRIFLLLPRFCSSSFDRFRHVLTG